MIISSRLSLILAAALMAAGCDSDISNSVTNTNTATTDYDSTVTAPVSTSSRSTTTTTTHTSATPTTGGAWVIVLEDALTTGAMHGELKALCGAALAEQKQADLPRKCYTRSLLMSYQTLRRIYRARRKHRHPDWRLFCQWIESLPYFQQLIWPEGNA